jgi:hypothetical protein
VQSPTSSLFICIKRVASGLVVRYLSVILCLFVIPAHAQVIQKALMPGQLSDVHAKYEQDCGNCHKTFDKNAQTLLCVSCHKAIAKDIEEKKGWHGHLDDTTCRECHKEHKGRKTKLAVIDKEHFDHDHTGFQLKGAHKELHSKCVSCHISTKKFREASRQCISCHRKDDMDKGHKGKLGDQCEKCHGESKWKDVTFDHEKTKFHLVGGKHADVECTKCHTDNRFKDTPLDCNSCHKKDDQAKGHKGRYGSKCETCHTDKGWKELHFDHNTDTHFDLRGKHRSTKCDSCHLPEKGLLYQQKLSGKCIACHRDDDQTKGHKGSLGEKCDTCHNETSWKGSTKFDHDKTQFPLLGKHDDTKCEACHIGGVSGPNAKLKMEKTCVSCHRKDDQEKGHKGRYGDKCETCHQETGWKKTKFDHDRDTKYLLAGKHRETKCDACHRPEKGAIYQQKLASTCVSCHKADDKHKGQLGDKCESCHRETSWKVDKFDHNKSHFPLTGGHVQVECKKCHTTTAFHDAPKTCNGCHSKDDVHKRRFGTTCETCHSTRTWKSWDFDHSKTRFPLERAHQKVECYACHKAPIEGRATISLSCVSCHIRDDVHEGGFGAQCERCHAPTTWKNVRK